MRPLRKPIKSAEIRKQRINARLEQIQPDKDLLKQSISTVLEHNVELFKKMFAETSDFVVRQFHFGSNREIRVALIFIDGLVDNTSISESIFTPFMMKTLEHGDQEIVPQNPYDLILNWLVTFNSVKEEVEIGKLLDLLLAGFAILFIDGAEKALAIEVKGWATRSVEEPKAEAFVRGPREGFTETLRTNTALIRRRIRTPKLRFDMLQIGSVTKTDVCVAYIDGLVNPATVKEVKQRLERIDTDSILESGYLEDFIRDNYRTPFALLDRTERPDKVAGCLVEGRVAILVDTTPFVLIVPAVFSEFLQSPEDYYEAHDYIRPFRWVALVLTLTLPSFYVALTTFHQEMIPASLALSMAVGRAGVPFPAVVEALLMEVTFDLLREAGTRMPPVCRPGSWCCRGAGFRTGCSGCRYCEPLYGDYRCLDRYCFFSNPKLFVIYSYQVSALSHTLACWFIWAGGYFLGSDVFTAASCFSAVLWSAIPLSHCTFCSGEWKDVFYRAPWWAMDRRPLLFRSPNRIRQAPGQRPEPPAGRSGDQAESGKQEIKKNENKGDDSVS